MFSLMYSYNYHDNVIALTTPNLKTTNKILFENFNNSIEYSISSSKNFQDICAFLIKRELTISHKSQIIFYFSEDIYKMTIEEFIKTQQELNPEQFL